MLNVAATGRWKKKKHQIALCGELALKEAVDLSYDRQRNKWMKPDGIQSNHWALQEQSTNRPVSNQHYRLVSFGAQCAGAFLWPNFLSDTSNCTLHRRLGEAVVPLARQVISLCIMQPEVSSPCSQEFATRSYPESDESSRHCRTKFLYDSF